jgi:hypothetical protein
MHPYSAETQVIAQPSLALYQSARAIPNLPKIGKIHLCADFTPILDSKDRDIFLRSHQRTWMCAIGESLW